MRIPNIASAGIIVNYKCTARCAHCCYNSSPKWDNDYMSEETAIKIFDCLHLKGCRNIHIGGGEPFINPTQLARICKIGKDKGFAISYIETNASWCLDDVRTEHILNTIIGSGVDCLLISVDPFHNEYIPYDKARRLIECCERVIMNTFVWPNNFSDQLKKTDASKTHSLDELSTIFNIDYRRYAATHYGLTPNGRAINLFKGLTKLRSAIEIIESTDSDCPGLHSTSHCHLDLYENYIPPGCTGFVIDIYDMFGDFDNSKYPAISAAYSGGIGKLYEYAKTLDYTDIKEGYVNICHLCFEIKKHLSKNNPSRDIGYPMYFEEM